jgi:hypothetical protein
LLWFKNIGAHHATANTDDTNWFVVVVVTVEQGGVADAPFAIPLEVTNTDEVVFSPVIT